jgi:hypothetical protein
MKRTKRMMYKREYCKHDDVVIWSGGRKIEKYETRIISPGDFGANPAFESTVLVV